jgi:SAM-dependent methyltransferase
LSDSVQLHHVDLLNLGWESRWNVIFLLDVIEHIDDDERVLKEVSRALRPGGFVFVTTPALKAFWTYNDDYAGHKRRYRRRDFAILAEKAGLDLILARYFMFFLSPALLLVRMRKPPVSPNVGRQEVLRRSNPTPGRLLNAVLGSIFAAETPLGLWLPFPWGTSILGVFRKPLPAGQSAQ